MRVVTPRHGNTFLLPTKRGLDTHQLYRGDEAHRLPKKVPFRAPEIHAAGTIRPWFGGWEKQKSHLPGFPSRRPMMLVVTQRGTQLLESHAPLVLQNQGIKDNFRATWLRRWRARVTETPRSLAIRRSPHPDTDLFTNCASRLVKFISVSPPDIYMHLVAHAL